MLRLMRRQLWTLLGKLKLLDNRSLFKAGDHLDLAEKIDYWIDNEEEKKKMEKEYIHSAEQYRIDNSILAAERMYEEAMADHKKKNLPISRSSNIRNRNNLTSISTR